MKLKTTIKAGGATLNHNETLRKGVKVKTQVKAGGISLNHNETLAQTKDVKAKSDGGAITFAEIIGHRNYPLYPKTAGQGLKVKTQVKAGRVVLNHNETLVKGLKVKIDWTAINPTEIIGHRGYPLYPKTEQKGLKVKTQVKAGGASFNHNETLVRKGLKVKTSIKAGPDTSSGGGGGAGPGGSGTGSGNLN